MLLVPRNNDVDIRSLLICALGGCIIAVVVIIAE